MTEIPTDHVPILYENVDPTTIKQPKVHRDHGGQYAPNRQNSRHLFYTSTTRLKDSEEPGRADLQQPLVVRHVSLLLF